MNDNVFLSLGSNLGDRHQNLKMARWLIDQSVGRVEQVSSIYESQAWGELKQPNFYNQVLKIQTELTPPQLLDACLKIEAEMGRKRIKKWGQRVIDVDILYYASRIVDEPDLKIPHAYIAERRFNLMPLEEIASEFVHPELGKTNHELLELCTDGLEVFELAN